jgi:ubiquinone/menaquinone biosynthesis C-methylase UbiE
MKGFAMTTTTIEATKHKAQTQAQWDKSAKGWDSHRAEIRQWLRPATDAMLEMANIRPGNAVLDIAAGAGDQTIDVLERIGPTGNVVATDISENILKFAAENASTAGHANMRVQQADAEDLQLPDSTFDAAICRLGLMFLPNPQAGVSEALRVLKPGGAFCNMVFAGPELNPCVRILMSTALRHAGLPPRDPFQPGGLLSLGKQGVVDELFKMAGFGNVATTRMNAPFRLPKTQDYLEFVKDSAGPILQILGSLPDGAKADAWEDIEAQLDEFQTPDGWVGPNALLLTVGQR